MRPLPEDGKTPASKKRTHSRRGQKAVNGVKKTLVKAKVTAVKTKRKIQAGSGNADEVQDLLEMTANGGPSTPVGKAVANKTSKTSTAAKQMKKLKSIVSISNGATNGAASPRSRAERMKAREAAKIERGIEATEANITANGSANGQQNGGFLSRTVSRIWRLPDTVINGVSYGEMNGGGSTPSGTPVKNNNPFNGNAATASTSADNSKGCLIS